MKTLLPAPSVRLFSGLLFMLTTALVRGQSPVRESPSEPRGGAGADRRPPDMLFERMDADGDGTVTQEEMQAFRRLRGDRGRPTGGPRNGRGVRRYDGAPVGEDERERRDGGGTRTATVETGFVVAHGRSLDPPYTVTRTDEGLFLNDIPLTEPLTIGRIDGGRMGAGGGAWRRNSFAGVRYARRFETVCTYLGVQALLVVNEEETFVVPAPDALPRVFELLQTGGDPEEVCDALAEASEGLTRPAQWSTTVCSFTPSPHLDARLKDLARDQRQWEWQRRLLGSWIPRTFVYGGSLLLLLALGALLVNRPERHGGWQGRNTHPEAVAAVAHCILVLLLLNVFDLAATLVWCGSGSFQELNPLASRLLHSPWAVVAFKASLVAAGAALLYHFRRQRVAQQASWWLTLAYTALLLRWVAYQSILVV